MTDKLMAYLSEGEAFLVISPENRLYLTGFESTDGYLLVTAEESVFLTDSRYIEAARAKASGCTEIALLKSAAEDLNGYIKSLNINKVYIEASSSAWVNSTPSAPRSIANASPRRRTKR